jgi:beta-lactamase class A
VSVPSQPIRLALPFIAPITCLALLLAAPVPGHGQTQAQTQAQAQAQARTRPVQAEGKDAELARGFVRDIERIADGVDGIVSYHVVDLVSGQVFGRKAQELFPTASAIKVGILHELFRQADEGRVDLDARIDLSTHQKVGGAGVLQHLGAPVLTARDHAVLMILLSDNTATNLLIDLVGMTAVNQRMQALGAPTFSLQRRMMDLAAAAAGAENLASAEDLSRVLDAIRQGEGLVPASRDAALAILRLAGQTPLRAGVPAEVAVAAKAGSLDGVRTEAAYVALAHRPYLLTVMMSYLDDDRAGEQAITAISRTAYRYFDRLGRAGREGRLR